MQQLKNINIDRIHDIKFLKLSLLKPASELSIDQLLSELQHKQTQRYDRESELLLYCNHQRVQSDQHLKQIYRVALEIMGQYDQTYHLSNREQMTERELKRIYLHFFKQECNSNNKGVADILLSASNNHEFLSESLMMGWLTQTLRISFISLVQQCLEQKHKHKQGKHKPVSRTKQQMSNNIKQPTSNSIKQSMNKNIRQSLNKNSNWPSRTMNYGARGLQPKNSTVNPQTATTSFQFASQWSSQSRTAMNNHYDSIFVHNKENAYGYFKDEIIAYYKSTGLDLDIGFLKNIKKKGRKEDLYPKNNIDKVVNILIEVKNQVVKDTINDYYAAYRAKFIKFKLIKAPNKRLTTETFNSYKQPQKKESSLAVKIETSRKKHCVSDLKKTKGKLFTQIDKQYKIQFPFLEDKKLLNSKGKRKEQKLLAFRQNHLQSSDTIDFTIFRPHLSEQQPKYCQSSQFHRSPNLRISQGKVQRNSMKLNQLLMCHKKQDIDLSRVGRPSRTESFKFKKKLTIEHFQPTLEFQDSAIRNSPSDHEFGDESCHQGHGGVSPEKKFKIVIY